MVNNNLEIIKTAYNALKVNEAYWTLDNDYSDKYQYITGDTLTGRAKRLRLAL